jgi:molybdate transport system substrate-binding protein
MWLARAASLVGLPALSVLGMVACGGAGDSERELTVFAASSLTESMQEVGEAFMDANPGSRVVLNFAASSALATQINEGAPADVFAAADEAQMSVVTMAGNARAAEIFATNSLVVVTPAGDSKVREFADLSQPDLRLVLGADDVPVGSYAREALRRASEPEAGISADFSERVLANLKSNEPNVRGVLTRIQLGEADAGIVYRTDALAAGDDVTAVPIPEEYNVTARYPIAVVKDTQEGDLAAAFVEFVLSAEGQGILERHGFGAPTE